MIAYADLLGSFGGYAISVWYFKINSQAYWQFSAYGVALWDVTVGITKGFFFGAAIATVSCYKGFNCKQGAQGVGQACTEAFVLSFIAILAIDFAMAIISKSLYLTFWQIKSLI